MGRVFSDPATTRYVAKGHPEAPFRVARTAERLTAAGHKIEKPFASASPEDVSLLHSPGHFERVQAGDFDDPDTPPYPGIAAIALVSLAGAFSSAESAAAGEPAFSLMRPPGHHAGRDRVAGFCFFNNLALACARLQKERHAHRIAIVDVDVHHGDGTQELVLGKPDILFCSLHQVPLYPGSGLESSKNCLNFPLPPGTAEAAYLKTLERALQEALDFKPDLLAVSAGFDTYRECPIAQLRLEKASYRRIGRMLSETKLKRFAVLEGGYAEDLPVLVENFLDGFFA